MPEQPGSWEQEIRRRLQDPTPDRAPEPDPGALQPTRQPTPDGGDTTPTATRVSPRRGGAHARSGPTSPEDRPAADRGTGPPTEPVPDRDAQRVAARRGWSVGRRLGRRAVALVGSDDSPTRLAYAARAVQAPVSTGRRVLVLGAAGGSGATTTAVVLARVLALHRADGVAAVAAAGDRGALAISLGARGRCTTSEALGSLAAGTDRTTEVLAATDVPHLRAVTDAGVDPRAVAAVADRLGRRHAFTVTDGGQALYHPAAVLAHVVVVTAVPSVAGIHAATSVLDELVKAGVPTHRLLPVAVDTGRDTGISAARAAALLTGHGQAAMTMASDRHLAGGTRLDMAALADPAGVSAWELTARVVELARAAV